jgi:hypothetical protein
VHEKAFVAGGSEVATAVNGTAAASPLNPTWTETFATYIRHNDVALMESCGKILKEYEEELFVCEDWMEMFDVLSKFYFLKKLFFFNQVFLIVPSLLTDLLQDISDPVEFLQGYLPTVSK